MEELCGGRVMMVVVVVVEAVSVREVEGTGVVDCDIVGEEVEITEEEGRLELGRVEVGRRN